MKKYILTGAALLTSLSSSTFSANFNGPYAGTTAGVNSFQSGYTQTAANPNGGGSEHASNSATLLNSGLLGGYGQTFGQFYVGGELLLTFQNGKAKYNVTDNSNTGSSYATFKESYSINPVVRLGFLIDPTILAFLKLGLAGTQITANARPFNAPSGPYTTYKKTLWGWSLGLGLENLVTEHISIRADYTYNIYPTKRFVIPNPNSTINQGKISPRDNIFRLGVSYNF